MSSQKGILFTIIVGSSQNIPFKDGNMLKLLSVTLFAFSLYAFSQQPKTHTAPKRTMTPSTIHSSALVIDTHADTPQRLLDEQFDMDNAPAGDKGHIDFAKAKAGNLGGEFFSIWVEPKYKGHFAQRTLRLIDSVYQQAAKHPDKMTMAFTADDILAIHQRHRLAALMGIEGGHAIENDLDLLRDYYRLGVRYMTLTWSNTNEWADSSGDISDPNVKHHKGLTDFGKDVVAEMNRLGMMVDISHVSDETFYDALHTSRAPVIASHSSARALTNHPRNMTDEMLRAMTRNGGVVMVNFFSAFVDEDFRKAYAAQEKERNAAVAAAVEQYKRDHPNEDVPYGAEDRIQKEWAAKIPRPPLKSLIDHIDHIAKVAGIDHVGLGSDFDGVSSTPEGIDSAADLPKITLELAHRGYSAEQLHKILGDNLLRVFRQVERVSKELESTTRTKIAQAQSVAAK